SSRRRHTRSKRDWSSDVCSSDLSIPRGITSAIIKIAIWVIPVMFLVKIMEKDNPLSYLGLRHNFKKGLRWVSWVSLVFILYFFLNLTVLKNDIDFQMGFSKWLNTIL